MISSKLVTALRDKIGNDNIIIIGIRKHSKASEEYVDVEFKYPKEGKKWNGSIPYHYRRLGLFLEDPDDISKLINSVYKQASLSTAKLWIKKEKKLWETEYVLKKKTKPFFDKIANLRWNCVECDLPKNPNWARRVQDIKEMGYLVSTNRKTCDVCGETKTHILLVPHERGEATGYESWSPKLRKKIINVLNKFDVYEHKKGTSVASLLPDHKFPEIRWDENTKEENAENMSEEEIRNKFQLLSNQRNLQKREVCRKCYQTNKRGSAYGVKYYYKGDEDWSDKIPKRGKKAEKGCVGCPWYDFKEWHDSLNKSLEK